MRRTRRVWFGMIMVLLAVLVLLLMVANAYGMEPPVDLCDRAGVVCKYYYFPVIRSSLEWMEPIYRTPVP